MEYFFHFGLFLFFFCAYFRGIFVSDQRRDGVVLKRVSQLLAMKKILWLTLPLLLACSGMTGLMAQTNVSGTIMSNTFWTVANGPYIVTGDLLVDQAATLNLEPGHGFGLGFAVVKAPKAAQRESQSKGEFFWAGANSTHFFVNPKKRLVAVFMTQGASVGTPNPYGFYFGSEMRRTIYQGLK